MKKKILAAVMAATMVFSLVACGSSDAGSNAATGSANAATGSANAATGRGLGDVYKRQPKVQAQERPAPAPPEI